MKSFEYPSFNKQFLDWSRSTNRIFKLDCSCKCLKIVIWQSCC